MTTDCSKSASGRLKKIFKQHLLELRSEVLMEKWSIRTFSGTGGLFKNCTTPGLPWEKYARIGLRFPIFPDQRARFSEDSCLLEFHTFSIQHLKMRPGFAILKVFSRR
jgi:hypothetical protein